MLHHPEIFAAAIARIFLGFLFFFQGYDAVFKIKIAGVIDAIREPMKQKGVPDFFITAGAYFTSYVQLIGGLFLIIGLLKYAALYFLGIDLLIASIGFGITQPLWDMRFVFPRFLLLLFLLIIPQSWNVFGLDYFFNF
jgi:putative oxidoreductase